MGRVVADKATVSTPQEESIDRLGVYDSGCMSGGNLSSLGSPNHSLGVHPRDYQRLDSGICVSMTEGMKISEPDFKDPKVESKVTMSPQAKVLEYYDADSDGDCQLHLAVAEGVMEVVFALIRMAPHPAYLDIQNNELYAPLHLAVLVNQPRMVRRLVVAGATTDIRDREGNTPLHLAARRGLRECASALLTPISRDELREAQVSVGFSQTQLHAALNLKNYNGEHCVHLATAGQHYAFLQYLQLQQGDLNAVEGRSGKTALHYAVNMRDEALVRRLVDCGLRVNARDWSGRTALQCAHINGDEGIARFLASVPGCDTAVDDSSDEDFEFDTDEETVAEFNDIEVNGRRIVESMA